MPSENNPAAQARRNRLDLMQPAELAIFNAIQEVEKAGADIQLTDAIILLQQAKDKVSDYLDQKDGSKRVIANMPDGQPIYSQFSLRVTEKALKNLRQHFR